MKKNIIVAIIVALIIIAGAAYYYWYQPKDQSDPNAQVKTILAQLEKHIVLPAGETPQIGRIDDPIQATKAQPFVTGAQKGDLLIVFVKAQKAIVYSPSRDLIINVGPVSVTPPANSRPAPVAATTTAKTPTKK